MGLAGDYVRFQQTYGGVPVMGAGLVVALPADQGRAPLVGSSYEVGLAPPPVQVRTAASDAMLTSLRSLGASAADLRGQPSGDSVYLRVDKDWVLGWRVVLPLSDPLGTWLVAIDAATGSVLFKTNLLRFDEGRVFDPNPAKTSGGSIPPPTDYDSAANESLLNAQYVMQELLGIEGGQGKLKGQFVDLTAPGILGAYKAAGQADEPSGIYDYSCTDDRLEETMVYYHVDAVQRKIQSLGYSGSSGVLDRPVPAHAHYFDDCNAFYDPWNRGMHFGDGDICTITVDAAEDADVIVHEYGHAIQDDQVPAFGFGFSGDAEQAWAIGEGFSDFLTAATFGDPCVGEWFAAGSCLRTLENTRQYPDDFEACRPIPPDPAEPHCAGLIWGGALWDLVQALGGDQSARDQVLTLVLESHFMMDPLSTFAEAAAAIRQADTLLYNGMHVSDIDLVFSARGINSLGSVTDFPYAYVRIRHTFPDDLDIQLQVGSISSPVCSDNVWDPNSTPPFSSPDLIGYEDLSASVCIGFLPPTPAQPWYLEVRDAFAMDEGVIEEFEVVLSGSERCVATDVPTSIPDNDGFVYSMVDCSTTVGPGAGDDVDGDGFSAAVETYVGTDLLVNCGNPNPDPPYSLAWPADLLSQGTSENRVDLQDLGSFVAPIPHFKTSPGDPFFDQRWELVPRAGVFPDVINLQDLGLLVVLAPPMFGHQSAFNQSCS